MDDATHKTSVVPQETQIDAATASASQLHEIVARIRAEYLEMPGMRLSAAQVQRLCGVDARTCEVVMDSLVAVKFLSLNPDGTYVRRTADTIRARTLRAPLPSSVPFRRQAG